MASRKVSNALCVTSALVNALLSDGVVDNDQADLIRKYAVINFDTTDAIESELMKELGLKPDHVGEEFSQNIAIKVLP